MKQLNSNIDGNKTKWQETSTTGNFGTDADEILEFTGLTIGVVYEYMAQLSINLGTGTTSAAIGVMEDTTEVKRIRAQAASGDALEYTTNIRHRFTATKTTIKIKLLSSFTGDANTLVRMDNGGVPTSWATLEELPNHVETDQW